MAKGTVGFVDALRKEHSNITQLLDVLERNLAVFDRGGTPDYEIVEGIVDYFQSFPDLYHHPKEDLLFQRLKRRDPEAAARFGDLTKEHEELAARTRDFAAGVRAVLDDTEVPRDALDAWGRRFIDFQREHMAREERLLFSAALAALTAEDWAEIEARASDQEDPLFGDNVGKRYEVLRRDILQWQRESGEP